MLGAPVFRTALFGPWSGNALWTAARAVPSLDLCFADKKDLICASSGRQLVTFARASSGTYVDSAGVLRTAATDVPRFDHNPLTGESLGLLVEEQRTNLRLNSATYQPSSGGTPAAYTVDQVAPDGTTTGSRQTAATPRTFEDYTGIANALYTFSFYCRVTSGTAAFSIQLKNAASDTVITSDTSPVATTAWRRFTISGTTAGATPGARVELVGVVPGFVLWGAQLEAGATASSYIPTTTAAATRSASLADLISSAIANNIRSFYVEFSSPAVGTRGAASLNDNTANERIEVITSGTDPRLVVRDGGVEQANINGGTVTAGVKTRVAVRISANDFAISINGSTAATDTSGTLPTVDRLMIGRTQAGEYLNGRIARFAGWTELLSDVTLQSLSQP
jgi:hypothetical protein